MILVSDYLTQLDIHMSMEPGGMHLRVLRELAKSILGPSSGKIVVAIFFFHNDWKKRSSKRTKMRI